MNSSDGLRFLSELLSVRRVWERVSIGPEQEPGALAFLAREISAIAAAPALENGHVRVPLRHRAPPRKTGRDCSVTALPERRARSLVKRTDVQLTMIGLALAPIVLLLMFLAQCAGVIE